MPEIIIQKREDITDRVRITLNGNMRLIEREKKVNISDGELNVLMDSHEAPYVFIIPDNPHNNTVTFTDIKEINGHTGSTIRVDTDCRGNETGIGKNSKLR